MRGAAGRGAGPGPGPPSLGGAPHSPRPAGDGRPGSAAPVLVVGGGPAGSTTALHLARAGQPVTIVDRAAFPRAKACGECANPGTVRELRALGLGEQIADLDPGCPEGWELQTPTGRVVRARFGEGQRTWVVDRSRLDAALLEAAVRAGARFESGVSFSGVEEGGHETQVRLRHGDGRREVREARFLVGADGLHSRVRLAAGCPSASGDLRKVGLSLHLEGVDLDPRWGRLVLDPAGTIGLSPLDPTGDRWTLVHVTRSDRDDRRTPLPIDASRLIALAARQVPQLSGARAVSPVLGSGPFDRPVARPWATGIVLVGDAAGYYDPVTGQGIGRALHSARLAAEAILAGGDEAALRRYGTQLDAARRGGTRVQRVIEFVARRPALLERLLPAMARAGLLHELISVTGDLAPASDLWSPAAWPRWGRALLGATLSASPPD